MKEFFEAVLESKEEAEEFAKWAFGEDFRSLNTYKKYLEEWNALHADDLLLHSSSYIAVDVPRMITLWRLQENHN